MRIANIISGTGVDFEQRKSDLLRKEMDAAYKKNSKYADPSKNPMLIALENLLSGKTEQDLHEQDLANKDASVEDKLFNEQATAISQVKSQIPQVSSQIFSAEKSSNEESLAVSNVSDSLEGTIETLEKIRQAALAPANPTEQDLRVAASATSQIQAERGESSIEMEEVEPFADESFNVDIPERFLKDVKRDAEADTVFGKDLEKLLVTRTYNKAKAIYSNHIDMVKNNYRSYNEPLFSLTA